MLCEDTADCLALANTAILLRLIEELIDRGVVAKPSALLQGAVSDLETCPEHSARVDDAVRLIRKELMPRLWARRVDLIQLRVPLDSARAVNREPWPSRMTLSTFLRIAIAGLSHLKKQTNFALAAGWRRLAFLLPLYGRKY